MFRVLIPSLCITKPLTVNLFPSFWVIRSFPIPLETIKRGGDFYFDLYKSGQSNGLVLNISTTTVGIGVHLHAIDAQMVPWIGEPLVFSIVRYF